MIITLKNKDTLIVDEFKLKCCIGKKGIKNIKKEGDYSTPKGTFKIRKLFWRADRVRLPETKLKKVKINKSMGWCTDVRSNYYNKQFKINSFYKHEKLKRNDFKYDYFILIEYNYKNVVKGAGSAIFLHITKDYKPTAGCIAIKKKDFLILAKILKKNSFIKIH